MLCITGHYDCVLCCTLLLHDEIKLIPLSILQRSKSCYSPICPRSRAREEDKSVQTDLVSNGLYALLLITFALELVISRPAMILDHQPKVSKLELLSLEIASTAFWPFTLSSDLDLELQDSYGDPNACKRARS